LEISLEFNFANFAYMKEKMAKSLKMNSLKLKIIWAPKPINLYH